MSLKTWVKGLINPESEEITLEKKKKKENHTHVSSIEMALDLANIERAKYPSNKVKVNEYRFKDSSLRGYKVIPFVDVDLNGNPSTVEIFKIKI